MQEQTEEIFGYLPSRDGIVFQVRSGGCTHKSSFAARLHRDHFFGATELLLVRIRPDFCYAYYPRGVKLNFSFEELGLNPGENVQIMNPKRVIVCE